MVRRKLKIIFIGLVLTGLLIIPMIPSASATSWNQWKTAAVGDVPESELDTYWLITSTPVPNYEENLWASWHDVVETDWDGNANLDEEFVLNTWDDSSIMGYITFESKMEIEEAGDLDFRGKFGCYTTLQKVRTVGSVEIYDKTTQTTIWKKNLQTTGTPNSWDWVSFHTIESMNSNHEYVIRLKAKDSWSSHKVTIAFDSAEVWFYSPATYQLNEYDHDWSGSSYRCWVESLFSFRQGQLDDMLREHLPYVNGWGPWYGWDPCYLHEFRSEPYYSLVYDFWWVTNMPGTTGVTWSSLLERQEDEYEEVEVYTRGPVYLQENTPYWAKIRYEVQASGNVYVTLEAELGNQADIRAWVDPPAVAVGWLELVTETFYHSQSSGTMAVQSSSLQRTGDTIPIEYIEENQWFGVSLTGMSSRYLKIYTRVNVASLKTRTDVVSLISDVKTETRLNIDRLTEIDGYIPATLTFDRIISASEIEDLVERYNLEIDRFRFTALNDHGLVRGQGACEFNKAIPLAELNTVIGDGELLGFQSIDVRVHPYNLESIIDDESVAVLDISAIIAILNAGIDINSFYEVQWITEDPSWYINHAFE
ncbi:MAG: hypothetical protein RTU92_01815 [Candidatus Thorarchaeota archaeon]